MISDQPFIFNIPNEDFQRCYSIFNFDSWESLSGKHIFITGATGFVGKWLLATLIHADKTLNLGCKITALSRNPDSFIKEWPAECKKISWIQGDIKNFHIPNEKIDIIIHAATDVIERSSPLEIFSTCHDGTKQIISLANNCGAQQLLLISSGAIYGSVHNDQNPIAETYNGGPDPLSAASAYAEGKRVSEWLVSQAASDTLKVKIARIFSLVGPHLPLDKHFAIGNFLRATMLNNEIILTGDGSSYRSYLYAADMAGWLWTILKNGKSCRAYNVGSDQGISILELAKTICKTLDNNLKITTTSQKKTENTIDYYVPDISRALNELNLPEPLSLRESIIRTNDWHQSNTK